MRHSIRRRHARSARRAAAAVLGGLAVVDTFALLAAGVLRGDAMLALGTSAVLLAAVGLVLRRWLRSGP